MNSKRLDSKVAVDALRSAPLSNDRARLLKGKLTEALAAVLQKKGYFAATNPPPSPIYVFRGNEQDFMNGRLESEAFSVTVVSSAQHSNAAIIFKKTSSDARLWQWRIDLGGEQVDRVLSANTPRAAIDAVGADVAKIVAQIEAVERSLVQDDRFVDRKE